jgi:2-polyprenyl-3-methyl-5-hydroxy-6-metoxy-1,4-benzoquinol methylase
MRNEVIMYKTRDFLNSITERMDIGSYEIQHAKRFARTVEETNRLFKYSGDRSNIRVLDFGSLTGALSIALKEQGYKVHSIDLESVVAQYKQIYERNGIEIRSMTESAKLSYEDQYFDCVIFAETLEHIHENPVTILDEFKRVLKVGGFLIVTTPNVMRLENKLKFLLNINIYQDLYRYVHNPRLTLHYREYTKRELVTLLEDYAKLPVVRIALFDFPGGRTPFRRLVQRVLYLSNYVLPGFKGALLAIARKPPLPSS